MLDGVGTKSIILTSTVSWEELFFDARGTARAWEGRTAMSLIDLLVLLLIAGLCGALGQAISGYTRGGCLVSIALGFIGALLGGWIARRAQLPELFAVSVGGMSFPIVWSIIGAALFVAVISLISRSRA